MTEVSAQKRTAASIRQRLLDRAKARDENYQLLLDVYAVERLIYRLSISQFNDRFVLKGAMLFALWFDTPHRPTRDADFLGLGALDAEQLAIIVRGLCAVQLDDGVSYDIASIDVAPIRKEARYDGLRISVKALIGTARCSVQWDVGFGDAVNPAAKEVEYPTLLVGSPVPRLHVYPRETVFAEKFEAIVKLGLANSRMKDYFDLLTLARENAMDATLLAQAIAATFARRDTPLPSSLPVGLTDAFARDPMKQTQWQAFLRKNRLAAPDLSDVVTELAAFSQTALTLALAFGRKH
jgi:predicted nucleotidyltransferase component of viral defense system